jgi:hypothetical protein
LLAARHFDIHSPMIVNGHPNSDIDQLLPWAYCRHDLKAVVLRKRGVFGVIKRELRRCHRTCDRSHED